MQPRLLFVAGMTIGVMAPLIWAAYVSVPAFRAPPERAGDWGQRAVVRAASREIPRPQSTSRSAPTTSSIETAAAAVSDSPQPKSDLNSVTAQASPALEPEPKQLMKPNLPQVLGSPDAPCNEICRASSKGASTRKLVDRAPLRDGPDAIDLYLPSGPHIIIVCSELTRMQKLRMGCS